MRHNTWAHLCYSIIILVGVLAQISCSESSRLEPKKKKIVRSISLTAFKDSTWNFGSEAYRHAHEIVSFGPRPAQSKELELTRQYLQKELKQLGWLVRRQAFVANTPLGKFQFVNLYARFGGENSDPDLVWQREHRGVIAAHIDSKRIEGIRFVGAVDAAGPVGMLVEIAHFLSKKVPQKAKSIELAFFDGEEAVGDKMYYQSGKRDGLYGSHYYALKRNGKREFGIVLDLLGKVGQKVKVPSDSPPELYRDLMAIARAHKVEESFGMAPHPIIDDHIPLNIFGTPSIDLIGEFSPNEDGWWHQASDTMEIISEQQLGMNLKVAIDLILTQLDK